MKAKIKTGFGELEVSIERGVVMVAGVTLAIDGDSLELDLSSLAKVPTFKVVEPEGASVPVVEEPAPLPRVEPVASPGWAPVPKGRGGRKVDYDREGLMDCIVEAVEAGHTEHVGVYPFVMAAGFDVKSQAVSDCFMKLVKEGRLVKVKRGVYAPVNTDLWERVRGVLAEKGPTGASSLRLYKDLGGVAKVGMDRIALHRKLDRWREEGRLRHDKNAFILPPERKPGAPKVAP